MERVNKIRIHPVWREQMTQLKELEKDRIFCRHNIEHLLDVARIAYIQNLEGLYGIEKELIYAAAFLHDIGRSQQYTHGIPHEKAGIILAGQILKECGFDPQEQEEILTAISSHRTVQDSGKKTLSGLLCWADKKSRMCIFCSASEKCNWSEEKKNHFILL